MADVGHLHDFEHRLSSPWLRDKLGDVDQSFRRELAYEAELILNDNDTSDGAFKGGSKGLQLFGESATWWIGFLDGLTLARSIRVSRELYSRSDKRTLPQHKLYQINLLCICDVPCERKKILGLGGD